MIANHERARAQRAALDGSAKNRWSQLRYPMLIFRRWREQKALSRLIGGVPATAEGARCKLVYLMATMIADGARNNSDDVETIVDTLRPYQDSLTACLRK